RDRTFEEVRDLVEKRWRDEEVGKKLTSLADNIRAKVDSGESLAKAAPGVAVERRDKIKRGARVERIDADAVGRIFATADGKGGIYAADDATSQIVFRITSVKVPPFAPTPTALKALSDGMKDDFFGAYIVGVESDLGVSVNEAALRSVVGADRN